jgi:hypothetical protein
VLVLYCTFREVTNGIRPEGIIMTADQPIDVQRFIDARGLSHVQVLLLVLCFLVVALDGFDTIAIGFIARSRSPV